MRGRQDEGSRPICRAFRDVVLLVLALAFLCSCSSTDGWVRDEGAPYGNDASINKEFCIPEWVDLLPRMMKCVEIGDDEDLVFRKIGRRAMHSCISARDVMGANLVEITYDLVEVSEDRASFRRRFDLKITWVVEANDVYRFKSYRLVPAPIRPE